MGVGSWYTSVMTKTELRKRFRKARAAYRKHKTRDNLRRFMHYKALMGWGDDRMFAYYGKSHRVNRGCRRAARRANAAWLVVTSTTDGAHAPGSFHNPIGGVGRAVDFGLPAHLVGTAKGRRMLVRYQRKEFNAWRRGRRPALVELIGPDNNMIVLRGRHAPLPEGNPLENQHDNHVHEAFTR